MKKISKIFKEFRQERQAHCGDGPNSNCDYKDECKTSAKALIKIRDQQAI